MTIKNRVYINTTSLVCCAGNTQEELLENIYSGKTGIEYDNSYFNNTPAALGKINSNTNFFDLMVQQCNTLLQKSNLDNFEKTLLVVGSSVGGINLSEKIYIQEGSYTNINPNLHNIHTIQTLLEKHFHFLDGISFSTACTSSANALGYGYEVIQKGLYENVLVIGVDALSQTTVGGFLSLGVLSSSPCKPFDTQRDGMNVAEAIGCLLLQKEPINESVELCGVGYSSDAYHMTHPHPEGLGAKKAMENALQSANLSKEQIDYINAHGTGTQANDEAEAKAIESLFEHKPFVSSTKSITGHTLGAAGAIEAIISKMVLNQQKVPQNNFLQNPENLNISLSTSNVETNINYVLSNSFAFGGNNCSLVFGKIS